MNWRDDIETALELASRAFEHAPGVRDREHVAGLVAELSAELTGRVVRARESGDISPARKKSLDR